MVDDTRLPMGCCRPRLLRLGKSLLLSGGRCTPHAAADNHLWLNTAGDAAARTRHSLSYWHNRLAPPAMPKYSPDVNCSGVPPGGKCADRETLGYTSLLPVGQSRVRWWWRLGGKAVVGGGGGRQHCCVHRRGIVDTPPIPAPAARGVDSCALQAIVVYNLNTRKCPCAYSMVVEL